MYLYRVNGFFLMLYNPALIVWALKEALLPRNCSLKCCSRTVCAKKRCLDTLKLIQSIWQLLLSSKDYQIGKEYQIEPVLPRKPQFFEPLLWNIQRNCKCKHRLVGEFSKQTILVTVYVNLWGNVRIKITSISHFFFPPLEKKMKRLHL